MLTTLNGTKVCTKCPYRYSFKYKNALEKKRNVPRKCPVPMCPASPFTLNIQCHLQLVHPGLDPKTIEVSDWIVEKQIAWPARKTKAEKGEKVRRFTMQAPLSALGHINGCNQPNHRVQRKAQNNCICTNAIFGFANVVLVRPTLPWHCPLEKTKRNLASRQNVLRRKSEGTPKHQIKKKNVKPRLSHD